MGHKRKQRRLRQHLFGWLVPTATKPKIILNSPMWSARIAQMVIDYKREEEEHEEEWYAEYCRCGGRPW